MTKYVSHNGVLSDPWAQGQAARQKRRGPKPVSRAMGAALRPLGVSPHEADLAPRDVPCRTCGAAIELSGFAALIADKVNEILASRGDEPQGDAELIFCPPCNELHLQRQEAARAAVDSRAAAILAAWRATDAPLSAAGYEWLVQNGYQAAAESCASADRSAVDDD